MGIKKKLKARKGCAQISGPGMFVSLDEKEVDEIFRQIMSDRRKGGGNSGGGGKWKSGGDRSGGGYLDDEPAEEDVLSDEIEQSGWGGMA